MRKIKAKHLEENEISELYCMHEVVSQSFSMFGDTAMNLRQMAHGRI